MSKKTLSFQLDQNEAERIESRAAAENRSVSSFLRNILAGQGVLFSRGVVTPATSSAAKRTGSKRAQV